jgi:AcrR family transcriptional regulator
MGNQRTRLQDAMIELVAERGFEGVTVRQLSNLAGVSTGTFYRHFANTEECFASTYDLVMQCALQRALSSSHRSYRSWEKRLRVALRGLMSEIADRPAAASFALVGAFTVGPGMLTRMRFASAGFEKFLGESAAAAPESVEASPRIVRGIVAGTARVVRTRLLAGRAAELPETADRLADWMCPLLNDRAAELSELGWNLNAVKAQVLTQKAEGFNSSTKPGTDERARILAAVAKLGAREGYWRLTIPMIRGEAGVSRRCFDSQFKSLDDCFLEAVESLIGAASARAEQEARWADGWGRGVYRAALTFCREIVRNPAVAQLGFVDVFAPGRHGLLCRAHLIALAADRLRKVAPSEDQPSALATEASMAAAWRITRDEIVAGRFKQLPQIAPTIAYLTLAPTIGADSAIQAIRDER